MRYRTSRIDAQNIWLEIVPSLPQLCNVHAFICSRVYYCNSLLVDLPKLRLSLQSDLTADAKLIARLPRFSHISAYMTEVLQWLPITSRIHHPGLQILTWPCTNITRRPGFASRSVGLSEINFSDLYCGWLGRNINVEYNAIQYNTTQYNWGAVV